MNERLKYYTIHKWQHRALQIVTNFDSHILFNIHLIVNTIGHVNYSEPKPILNNRNTIYK